MKMKLVRKKKINPILVYLILCTILSIVGFIFNFGWFRASITVYIIPVFLVYIFVHFYITKRDNPLIDLNIVWSSVLSNLMLVIAFILMPDSDT